MLFFHVFWCSLQGSVLYSESIDEEGRQFSSGVKALVVSFSAYWGTAMGQRLRDWCRHWRWVGESICEYI
jgi:hypothetical protein